MWWLSDRTCCAQLGTADGPASAASALLRVPSRVRFCVALKRPAARTAAAAEAQGGQGGQPNKARSCDAENA